MEAVAVFERWIEEQNGEISEGPHFISLSDVMPARFRPEREGRTGCKNLHADDALVKKSPTESSSF